MRLRGLLAPGEPDVTTEWGRSRLVVLSLTWACLALVALPAVPNVAAHGPAPAPAPVRPDVARVAAIAHPGRLPHANGGPAGLTPSNLTGAWSSLGATPGLSARVFPAMAEDPDLGGVVLFGGAVPNLTAGVGGTWLYRNGTWSELDASFASNPTHARFGGALVWDPTADDLVLFGGRNGSTSFNDTWVLSAANVTNGHGWSNLTRSVAPTPREFSGSFFDPNASALILYGGICNRCGAGYANITYNDTWSFRSGNWTNVTPTDGIHPDAVASGAAAWDPDLQAGIYFGGVRASGGCNDSNSTWSYDGNWTQLAVTATPGNVTQASLQWYPPGHELLLFAGTIGGGTGCAVATNNTWVLTGRSWADLTLASGAGTTIGYRYGSGGAYDPDAHVALVFGGAVNNTTALNDLWAFPSAPLSAFIATGGVAAANGTALVFRANVTGGQSPYYYHWDFGDGSSPVGGAVTRHVYTASGAYVAALEVVDDAGRTWNATAGVTVVSALRLTASSGALHGDAPFYVTFNSSTGGGVRPYQWVWSFGDGFSGNSPNVTHEFMIEGTFHVSLNASDAIGDNLTVNFTAVVSGRMLASIVASAYSALTPAALNFSADLKGGTSPFTYAWTFLSGAYGAGPATSFTFRTVGTYNVSLNVTDSLGYVAQAIATVHIYSPMTANCSATWDAGVVPFTDSFSASTFGGAPPLYYSWNFGDGSPRVPGRTTSHEFFAAGHYTVELTVTDQLAESINTTTAIVVVAPLAVEASSDIVQGPAPIPVSLTASITGGLGPFAFGWTYGDGGVGSGPNGSHTYDTPGRYTAVVQVTDALGENVTGSVPLFVYAALQLDLAANPDSLTLGNVSTLTATVAGGVAPFSLAWTGLPPGCLSRNATAIDCLATAAGTYDVEFHARDAVGQNRSANLSLFVLLPAGCACPSTPAPGGLALPALAYVAIGTGVVVAVAAVGLWFLRRRARPPPGRDEAAGSSG